MFENILNPELIRQAASSPLGVLSLVAILLAVIALIFFGKSPNAIKVFVFSFLVAGVLGFAYAMDKPGQVVEETKCENFSGTWKSLDLPYDEKMEISQRNCIVDGSISGYIHNVKGIVKNDELYMDIERTNPQGCLNILRAVVKKHSDNDKRIKRTITAVVGNCNDVMPGTALPEANYEKY